PHNARRSRQATESKNERHRIFVLQRHLQPPDLPDWQNENKKVGNDIRNGKAQEKSRGINAGSILDLFGCCPLDGRVDAALEDGHEKEDDGPESDDSDDNAIDASEALDPENAAVEEQDA
ncbi:MAG: hypothetical protein Q9157_005711, partial [Trypethelium eluteriae]